MKKSALLKQLKKANKARRERKISVPLNESGEVAEFFLAPLSPERVTEIQSGLEEARSDEDKSRIGSLMTERVMPELLCDEDGARVFDGRDGLKMFAEMCKYGPAKMTLVAETGMLFRRINDAFEAVAGKQSRRMSVPQRKTKQRRR